MGEHCDNRHGAPIILSRHEDNTILNAVSSFLTALPRLPNQQNLPLRLLLALSGGVDSVVMLHVLQLLKKQRSFELFAVHVNHGISANASAWADFCRELCLSWAIPFENCTISLGNTAVKGIEATAREKRYAAMHAHQRAIQADWLVLAHHQQDQAETLLLQAIRGAGVKGLASMARVDNLRQRIRPLLENTRAQIEAYATRHALNFVSDESNDDVHYDRNYVRHAIFPALKSRFPAVDVTFSRVAGHMAEAFHLLDTLAAMDYAQAMGSQTMSTSFPLSIFQSYEQARAKNVFRWWLQQSGWVMPSEKRLANLLTQVSQWRADDRLSVRLSDNSELKRYKHHLYIVKLKSAFHIDLEWEHDHPLPLPDGSVLMKKMVLGQGIALSKIQAQPLRIQNRRGGEHLLWHAHRPARSLKVVYQMSDVPYWLRERIPLIFVGQTLVCIPSVADAADYAAKADEMGVVFTWQETD